MSDGPKTTPLLLPARRRPVCDPSHLRRNASRSSNGPEAKTTPTTWSEVKAPGGALGGGSEPTGRPYERHEADASPASNSPCRTPRESGRETRSARAAWARSPSPRARSTPRRITTFSFTGAGAAAPPSS